MQSVSIHTTQNVGIQYELAGLGQRIGAFIIDMAIMIAYLILIGLLIDQLEINTRWIQICFFLPILFYHLFCEVFFNGQSIGKHQMHIKVVKLDGTPATLGGYVLRWMLRLIEIDVLTGAPALISISLTKNAQRLGDIAAGTTVVKLNQYVSTQSQNIIRTLETDYQPVYPQAENLSPTDVQLIQDSLQAYKNHTNSKPVLKITEKVKEHLGVESDEPPLKFLYTILKDYNHLTSR